MRIIKDVLGIVVQCKNKYVYILKYRENLPIVIKFKKHKPWNATKKQSIGKFVKLTRQGKVSLIKERGLK